ncbi:MAG: hypothetical protein V1663_05305 [archaeon]
MNDETHFLRNLAFFLIFLILFALFITKLFYAYDELNILKKAIKENNTILYFGDSVIESIDDKDDDNRTLGQFLNFYLNDSYNLVEISYGAYTITIFDAFSEYLCNSKEKPQYVIIPINLRSFSPEWDSRPEYQFKSEINRLRNNDNLFLNLWHRFYNLFSDSAYQEHKNWYEIDVYNYDKKIGKVKDFDYIIKGDETNLEELRKNKFIYEYMYNLNYTHRKIISLNNTLSNFNKCNISTIVYITPIDYKKGTYYLGEIFYTIVNKNKKIIFEIGKNNNINIIDASFDLSSDNFSYGYTPNEHLKQKGRSYLAKRISRYIN